MSTLSPTLAISEFAAQTQFSLLAEKQQTYLKGLFLDYLRVASVGQQMSWSEWARNYVQTTRGAGKSRVLYGEQIMDPVSASFLNTIYAGSIEADDVHVGAMLHPGCIIFSVALALSDKYTYAQLMSAVAAGYEAMIRIALCIQPSHFARGFQSTATCGVFGAAVASSYLLSIGQEPAQRVRQIAQAIGIAASSAGGLVQFFHSGSTVKRLHAAQAASSGIKASLLVQAGFSGPPDILEGRDGFMRAYSDQSDFRYLLENLNSHPHILEVAVKPHACSARVLSAIEASASLCSAHHIQSTDIQKITLGIPRVIQGRLTSNHPKDLQEAQMSAPFAVAMSFTHPVCWDGGALNIDDFERALAQPEVLRLCQLVECVIDEQVESTSNTESVSAKVTIALHDGQVFSTFIGAPLGSIQRPLDYAHHVQRLSTELSKRYTAIKVQEIMITVEALQPESSLQPLITLLNA